MAGAVFKILGFNSDPSGKPYAIAGGGMEFKAEIPPEKISFSKSVQWNNNKTANTSAVDVMQYQGYEQEQLSVELILDSTGAFGEDMKKDVSEQIKQLNAVVYLYEGSIHKPRYLIVNLNAQFGFKGHLQNMDIVYDLFGGDGKPLRARVSLQFVSHIDKETVQRESNNQSPDMSHVFTIREGDSLPLMSEEVYNDSQYFLHVAEINELTNFRNLKVGEQLLFPPLINE